MGNSNSTQAPLQWSQSLDHPPDSRNRMKKGYFPPRHYIGHGHGGLVPPQKVLPTVNPAKAALRLKPTSNGAILHKGGTISGRKLLNELDLRPSSPETESLRRAIRKRHLSSSSLVNLSNDMVDGDALSGGGTSTPNLTSMDFNSEFNSRSQRSIGGPPPYTGRGGSNRDYDSEPDLRDGMTESIASMGDNDGSVSPPLPNSFTIISESPSKKQIRTKKKYQAPPPPPPEMFSGDGMPMHHSFQFQNQNLSQHQIMMMGMMMNGQITQHDSIDFHHNGGGGGKKKLPRLFKTKAQSKLSKQEQQIQKSQQRMIQESMMMEREMQMQMGNGQSSQWNGHNGKKNVVNSGQNGLVLTEDSGRSGSKSSGMGMTTSEQLQLEKVGHNGNGGQSKGGYGVQHRNIKTNNNNKSNIVESEGTKLPSSALASAAAAVVAGKKKTKPFAPLCSTKEDNHHNESRNVKESTRGRAINGAPVSLLSRQVISGRQASLAPTSVVNPPPPPPLTPTTTSSQSQSQSSNINGSSTINHETNNLNGTSGNHGQSKTSNNISHHNNNLMMTEQTKRNIGHGNDNGAQKKTFYFGMDLANSTMVKEVAPSSQNNGKIKSQSQVVSNSRPPSTELFQEVKKNQLNGGGSERSESRNSGSQTTTAKNNRNNLTNISKQQQETSQRQNVNEIEFAYKMGQRSSALESTPQLHKDELSKVMHLRSSKTNNKFPPPPPPQPPPQNKMMNDKIVNKKLIHSQRSESDSDGLNSPHHKRQDSGSFDIETPTRNHRSSRHRDNNGNFAGESSSDLSSSDVDIPLLIRPTLPQRRLDLPRFSPSAAWRALDSPRASGRSLSSEDGFSYEDRIHRMTRPCAPPRTNNERSGDSGISAGDGGSPANQDQLPDMLGGRNSSCSLSFSNTRNNMTKIKNKINPKNDPIMKCWTPEQDLDESSSEFEHDADLSPGPITLPGNNGMGEGIILESLGNNLKNVPPGLQTPPKFTTRSQLFSKNHHNTNGFNSDGTGTDNKFTFTRGIKTNGMTNGFEDDLILDKNSQRQHLYTPSNKSKFGKQIGNRSIIQVNSNSQDFGESSLNTHIVHNVYNSKSQNGQQQNMGGKSNGFGGNWFLSRSEPNSLNTLDVLEGNENFGQNSKTPNGRKRQSRERQGKGVKLSVMRVPSEPGDLLDKVFSRPINSKTSHYLEEGNTPHFHLDYHNEDEMRRDGESRSEIGYGPSSMKFESHSSFYDEESKANSLILFRRPFSHIMYLPSYDSRRLHPSSSSYHHNRRTKSVDHLDSAESNFYRSSHKNYQNDHRGSNQHLTENPNNRHLTHHYQPNGKGKKERERFARTEQRRPEVNNSPFGRSQSVPLQKLKSGQPRVIQHTIQQSSDVNQDKHQSQESTQSQQPDNKISNNERLQQEEESNRKKKFKFQSTLRVLERKKIEEQLSRQCEDKEMQRLREIESMRRVEEEFQRKRAHKENLELELNFNKLNGTGESRDNRCLTSQDWSDVNGNSGNSNTSNMSGSSLSRENNNSRAFLGKNDGGSKSTPSVITTSTNNSCSINSNQSSQLLSSSPHHDKISNSSNSKLILAQRQEPEGAPASSPGTDLRKELIHASRKRNGTGHGGQSHSNSSEMTQELSEFRQERQIQYFDYRRTPRTNTASPARFVESSSSDIFPLSRRTPVDKNKQNRYRSTVHPEVVCDIPVKPYPYMVNFSRLSGSASNLVMDDRPNSGMGMGSGPSSVISDNYRRDWANWQHNIRGSGASSHGGQPGRASSVASLHSAPGYTSDLTDLTPLDSPRVIHKRKSPLYQKYSHSPPASPMPPMSALSNISDSDKDGQSSILTTTPSGVFQLQPFKAKGYKPVAFKPVSAPSNHAIKLTSTIVQ